MLLLLCRAQAEQEKKSGMGGRREGGRGGGVGGGWGVGLDVLVRYLPPFSFCFVLFFVVAIRLVFFSVFPAQF